MQQGFPPIEGKDALVLVLGTGPSRVSLEKREYYGHPTNAFWPIMSRLFGSPVDSYEAKERLLLTHRVALWDTLRCFDREGSLRLQEGGAQRSGAFHQVPPLFARGGLYGKEG